MENKELIQMRLKEYFSKFMHWLVDGEINNEWGILWDKGLEYNDMTDYDFAPFIRILNHFDWSNNKFDDLTDFVLEHAHDFAFEYYEIDRPISIIIGDMLHYYENDDRFYDKKQQDFNDEFYNKTFHEYPYDLPKMTKYFMYEFCIDEFYTNNGLSHSYSFVTPYFFGNFYNDNQYWCLDYVPNGSIKLGENKYKQKLRFNSFREGYSKMNKLIDELNLTRNKEVFVFRNGIVLDDKLNKSFEKLVYQNIRYHIELSKCNADLCGGYMLHILTIPDDWEDDLYMIYPKNSTQATHYDDNELYKAFEEIDNRMIGETYHSIINGKEIF